MWVTTVLALTYSVDHNSVCFNSRITTCTFYSFFFSAHPQWNHFLCPTEAADQPVTASQLALATTRYDSNPGGYHLNVSTSSNSPVATGTLSGQSSPHPQTTGHHNLLRRFQPRRLAAYGQVLRPSIQGAGPPTMYLTQPIQIQQVDYPSSTTVPAYSRERLPNPPEYFQGFITSSAQHQQQSRQ